MSIEKKNRLFQYDFIRSIAMLFVIAVHALVIIDFSDPVSLFYFHVMQAVFFTCNGMFFMMSGKFALAGAKADLKYYLRKIESIIIPMLVFFLLRSAYEQYVTHTSPVGFKQALMLNTLGNLADTEYWFLYVLIGNLFLAPLLGKAFQSFGKKESIIFLVLGLLHHGFSTACTILNLPYAYTLVFSGWSLYFYLGALVEGLFEKKHRLWVYVAAIVALAVTVFLKYRGITVNVHDISPLFTIVVLGAFFALYEAGSRIPEKLQGVFSFVAKHSFSVFLCHMMVLEQVRPLLATVMGPGSIANHLLYTLVTLVGSVLAAVILDNTVIRWLKLAFRWLCDLIFFKKEKASN